MAAHRGIQREAAVLPCQHLAHVVGLDWAAAGTPAQHPHAYVLGDGGDVLWRQFGGGAKAPAAEVKVRSNGEMEVMVAGGCSVRYNAIGLRQSVSSTCTDADVTAVKQAMNSYLAEQNASR